MIFKGRTYRRSSVKHSRPNEPAGEWEVFESNPQRTSRIRKETGWEAVFPGTLNLRVASGVHGDLGTMRELFLERPGDVTHPTHPGIPAKRGGYRYYRATASARGEIQEVLVRRASNPHDDRCLELVAPVKLADRLRLEEVDEVRVSVSSVGGGKYRHVTVS